jgi:hypothetical protein
MDLREIGWAGMDWIDLVQDLGKIRTMDKVRKPNISVHLQKTHQLCNGNDHYMIYSCEVVLIVLTSVTDQK